MLKSQKEGKCYMMLVPQSEMLNMAFTQSKPLKDLRVAWAVTQKQSTLNVTGLSVPQTDGEQLDRSTEQMR